jgi:free fatty acid receptor 3
MNKTDLISLNNEGFLFLINLLFGTLGLVLNTITAHILSLNQFKQTATFRYFFSILIFQKIQIIVSLISQINIKYGNFYISKYFCKISNYIFYSNNEFINLIIALNSIDRFLSVKYPINFKFRKTYRFLFISIFLIFIFSALIYSPLLYFISSTDSSSNFTNCNFNDEKIVSWFSISNLIVSIIIPFLIMILMSCLVGYHLLKGKYENLVREKKLFKILVSMDIYFFICHFPFSLNMILGSLSLLPNNSISVIILLDFGYILFFIHNTCTFFVIFYTSIQFKNIFYSYLGINITRNRRIAPLLSQFS